MITQTNNGVPTVQQYKAYITQLSDLTFTQQTFINTMNVQGWIRSTTGYYRADTELTPKLENMPSVYIPAAGDYGAGIGAIPLLNSSGVQVGYYILYPEYIVPGNKLRIRMEVLNNSGTNVELYSLIGNSNLYLPTIEYYNQKL